MENLKNTVSELISNSQYDEACELMAKEMGLELETTFLENRLHFANDKQTRDVYECVLKRGNRRYKFKFGQSVTDSQHYVQTYANSKITFGLDGVGIQGNLNVLDVTKYINSFNHSDSSRPVLVGGKIPTLYDVLASVTKYDPYSFEDFCDNYGYDQDSRNAEKTYKAVCKEYEKMCSLFNEEYMEVLQEIW